MQCSGCRSTKNCKNGQQRAKKNYICQVHRQFVEYHYRKEYADTLYQPIHYNHHCQKPSAGKGLKAKQFWLNQFLLNQYVS